MAQPFFTVENEIVRLDLSGQKDQLWSYTLKSSGQVFTVTSPIFEVDGDLVSAPLKELRSVGDPQILSNGCTEYRFRGTLAQDESLALELVFRLPLNNPVVRFSYILKSNTTHRLTKTQGKDELQYLGLSLASFPQVNEVRFSDFVELYHSYCLAEQPLTDAYFAAGTKVMGPLLSARNEQSALVVAYEHGSQTPDAFVQFHLDPDRSIALRANKGNYFHGQLIDADHSYQTIWLQLAAVEGTEQTLAEQYRTFVLQHQSLQAESRKPYIFYNTWNYQERNKWWKGKVYLEAMHEERMLAEIDAAHKMGIDVFVIDTGWYGKTGDWQVNTEHFSPHLRKIKERLDGYGMKLGLWFDPTAAAVTSSPGQKYISCSKSWHGKVVPPHPIWETEESHTMCLVSDYSDCFANELIRLAREVGVTYFKWDAIGQYGCDDPHHWHGTADNSEQERADCYAFQMIREMTRIVEKVCAAVPEAIIDFDVTENQRAVGLAFLSAGKYFWINNGPYYANYNIPFDDTKGCNSLFFYPGPARNWIARTPLTYDKWLPSVLFLTHYLPDDPETYQTDSIASLILGQNGIWGDLPAISEEGKAHFNDLLTRYKVVRDDITQSTPVRSGFVGSSPEIYEKVFSQTRRGAVSIFSTTAGSYTYITSKPVDKRVWHSDGVEVRYNEKGQAIIQATFAEGGAKIIFFGSEK